VNLEEFTQYLHKFPLSTYPKGEILVSQGEIPQRAYVVEQGLLKHYDLSKDGSERLVDLNTTYDILPDSWVFGKSQSALYFCETVMESRLYSLPRQELVEFVRTNHAVERAMLNKYISVYTAQSLRISALTYSVANEKLLHTLRYLCIRFGKPEKDGIIELSIYLTHQQLAELLGLSRETTTNELLKLKKKNIVSYDRRAISINASKLSDAIGNLDYDELSLPG
jgi:CRP/FNR family transcriptional regulator